MKAKKSDVWPIVKIAFPDYKGRKFQVVAKEKVSFYDTNWGGGSRNQYIAVKLVEGSFAPLKVQAPWINPVEGQTVELPLDIVVVEYSIFCGHDMGITIYARPENMPKLLPQEVKN